MSRVETVKRVAQLGYLHFEVRDLTAWEALGTTVLGLGLASRHPDGAFSLRMDGHAQRFFITPGDSDDLSAIGWEVPDEPALMAVADRIRDLGIEVREATNEAREGRGVSRLLCFTDPGGVPSEIYFGPALASDTFRSAVVRSGFVADDLGLGHVVITANRQDESAKFYRDALGFRLSDNIVCDLHGFHVDIAFFHANARHHTVAFGDRQRKRLHHFMVEVNAMDDVGLALDRTMAAGLRVMQTLGRHPNDRMFSFYAKTPSGFQFELGWGGRSVDDATWTPTTYDHVSEWGHHPPEFTVKRPGAP